MDKADSLENFYAGSNKIIPKEFFREPSDVSDWQPSKVKQNCIIHLKKGQCLEIHIDIVLEVLSFVNYLKAGSHLL